MNKEQILEEMSKEDLEAIYEGISNAKETQEIAAENYASSETLVREEIAKVNQSYKSDGTTLDLSCAPKGLIKSALEVKMTGDNKLQAKLDMQDEFVAMMKNGNIPAEIVTSYHNKMVAAKEAKDGVKDAVENQKSLYPAEIVEAIALVVQKDIDEQKEDAEEDNSKKKAPKKDNSETLETVKGVLQILNESK